MILKTQLNILYGYAMSNFLPAGWFNLDKHDDKSILEFDSEYSK